MQFTPPVATRTPRVCKRSGCERPCAKRAGGCGPGPAFCGDACRLAHARETRPKAPPPVYPERPCALPECALVFRPRCSSQLYCCEKHYRKVANARALRGEERCAREADARESAAGRALLRVCFERCPSCSSPLSADGALVFCLRRCGYTDLLTAKTRDPREGTPEPAEDQDD